LIGVGLFTDGAFGAGWNGVSAGRGVSGLFAFDPGQLSAQVAALAAIGLCAAAVSAVLLIPFALIARRAPAATPQREAAPPIVEAVSSAPASDG
jgi:hypothetical protein